MAFKRSAVRFRYAPHEKESAKAGSFLRVEHRITPLSLRDIPQGGMRQIADATAGASAASISTKSRDAPARRLMPPSLRSQVLRRYYFQIKISSGEGLCICRKCGQLSPQGPAAAHGHMNGRIARCARRMGGSSEAEGLHPVMPRNEHTWLLVHFVKRYWQKSLKSCHEMNVWPHIFIS